MSVTFVRLISTAPIPNHAEVRTSASASPAAPRAALAAAHVPEDRTNCENEAHDTTDNPAYNGTYIRVMTRARDVCSGGRRHFVIRFRRPVSDATVMSMRCAAL